MSDVSIVYAIPYLLLSCFVISVFFIDQHYAKTDLANIKRSKLVRASIMIAFVGFFAFRGLIGWDWYSYYPMYDKVASLLAGQNDRNITESLYEPGFITYISVYKLLGCSYGVFTFFNTVIDLVVVNIFLRRYSSNYALSCVVFLIMGGFYYETDLLRNAKSILLFLLSIRYLEQKKILPYMLLNGLGVMFHFSAFFFIPLYFFLNRELSRKVIFLIFIIGVTIFLLNIEFIKPIILSIASIFSGKAAFAIDMYLNSDLYSSPYGLSIGFVERIVFATLIVVYYDKIKKQSFSNIMFINSYVLFFIFFFYCAEINILPVRVGGLFYYSYWIITPAIFFAIQKKNNRILFIMFIVILTLFKMNGMTNTIIYRYDNQLWGVSSYEERSSMFDRFDVNKDN